MLGVPPQEFPEQAWEKVMSLNVTSVFQLTRACLPLLEAAAAAGGTFLVSSYGQLGGSVSLGW